MKLATLEEQQTVATAATTKPVRAKNKLTTAEANKLSELEKVIQHHFETFSQAGHALNEIRDTRLYRETHATFEDYCRARWEMSKTQANRLISAARVVENVAKTRGGKDIVEHLTESAIRPLTQLAPAQQRRVIEKVVEQAPPSAAGRGVTAKLVQSIARSVVPSAFKKVKANNGGRRNASDLIRRSELLGSINVWEKAQMASGKFANMTAREALKAVRDIVNKL